MSKPRKVYWDTTCFICFLNRNEDVRRKICEDVLVHAERGEIEIWTSTWTIVEVIRPRRAQAAIPALPPWAAKAFKEMPDAGRQLTEMWGYYHRNTAPFEQLAPDQIKKIEGMFQHPWLHKIVVDERVSTKAVELCRTVSIKPADAVHAASAILKKVDCLQRWDRDFDKVQHLIAVEEPQRLSQQQELIEGFRRPIGPSPGDF